MSHLLSVLEFFFFSVCTIDWCYDAGEPHCNLVNMQLLCVKMPVVLEAAAA